jgi:3'-phosphoadenosine 5'-phosphosulfate (PAPS) 3'-phosphatase
MALPVSTRADSALKCASLLEANMRTRTHMPGRSLCATMRWDTASGLKQRARPAHPAVSRKPCTQSSRRQHLHFETETIRYRNCSEQSKWRKAWECRRRRGICE